MFLGAASSGVQKAMVTVMESPNCAKVPGVPVNRAWTFFMGSIHAAGAVGGSAAWISAVAAPTTSIVVSPRNRKTERFIMAGVLARSEWQCKNRTGGILAKGPEA